MRAGILPNSPAAALHGSAGARQKLLASLQEHVATIYSNDFAEAAGGCDADGTALLPSLGLDGPFATRTDKFEALKKADAKASDVHFFLAPCRARCGRSAGSTEDSLDRACPCPAPGR